LVPQDIALYPALTAHENLAFFGRIYGLSGSRLEKRIAEVLELVCLEEKAHQPVHTYSGGMKRRANLAVGLLHRPQLLYLDEPTVGIDAQSRFLILERLATLRDAGITMLYTTHYMEEAQKLCDRIAIMDEGQIIAEGTPDALLARRPECTNLGELFLALTGKDLRE
jgi:ABC-2 type transport system ATP-binding protein